MWLLPPAPADSVGERRRQSAEGKQRDPLAAGARWNKGSATMRRSNGNTLHNGSHPWESSQSDSSEWLPHEHNDKQWKPPTDGVKLSIISKEKENRGRNYRVSVSQWARQLSSCCVPSLASHSDAKETVILIVQMSLSASSDFQQFQINCYTKKTTKKNKKIVFLPKALQQIRGYRRPVLYFRSNAATRFTYCIKTQFQVTGIQHNNDKEKNHVHHHHLFFFKLFFLLLQTLSKSRPDHKLKWKKKKNLLFSCKDLQL